MHSKKIKFTLLLSIALAGIFFLPNACQKEYVKKDPLCYERDVKPIIVANCTGSGCHNATDREKGRDYTDFASVLSDVKAGDYLQSKLYQVIVKRSGEEAMPPKPADRLTDEQIRIVATWIAEGATNDSCAVSTCDTSGVMRYSLDIRPILQNNCTGSGCHSGASPGGGISYSSYSGTQTSALNGSLLGSILQDGSYSNMPKGGSKLPDCSIAKIKKWIESGAPNN